MLYLRFLIEPLIELTCIVTTLVGGRNMGCPAPGVPMTGSIQRNKMFGAVGGGMGAQQNFMQQGGSNIAAQYMQNKLRNSRQQGNIPGSNFGMPGSKPSHQQIDAVGNDDNMHQVRKGLFILYT